MALGVLDSQYDKFRTPYFKIKIGDAAGKNLVEMPPSLLRLVEKIEVTETMAGCNITSQFSIVFKEGSREPFKKGLETSAKGLYLDSDATNATGMLTDLRFADLGNGTVGFSSVVASAVGAAQNLLATAQAVAGAAAQVTAVLGGGGDSPAEDKKVIADDTAKLTNVTYVFQEKNIVEIKWGYLEDSQSERTLRGNIIVVQTDFPEAGHPQTTINCAGPGSWLDQLAPLNALYFKTDSVSGFDPTSGPLYTFEDQGMEDTLKKLFPGFKIIVSQNLLSEKVDKYHTKVLPAGKSPEQFLRQLKKQNNAMYISYYSPKDGKPVIAYISRNDFQQKEIIENRSLFTYKAPGSILKSISVKADFNGLSGAGVVGTASDGTQVKAFTNNGNVAETMFEGKSILDTSPATGNKIPEAEQMNGSLFGNGNLTVSKVELSPSADDPSTLTETAQATAACRNRLIFLEFTSMGYTKLTTGVVYFGGIGNRYSGQYEVLTVTHVIDGNGYNIRGTAQSAMIDGASGVKPAQASQAQPSQTSEQLFQGASAFPSVSPSDVGLASALIGNPGNIPGISGGSAMNDYLEDIFA